MKLLLHKTEYKYSSKNQTQFYTLVSDARLYKHMAQCVTCINFTPCYNLPEFIKVTIQKTLHILYINYEYNSSPISFIWKLFIPLLYTYTVSFKMFTKQDTIESCSYPNWIEERTANVCSPKIKLLLIILIYRITIY